MTTRVEGTPKQNPSQRRLQIMKIKAYTRYNEQNNTHYYREFEVVDLLPTIGEVKEVSPEYDGERTTVIAIREVGLDCCQGNDEVYNYNYFEIVETFERLDDDDNWYLEETQSTFVAIPKKNEEYLDED
jgi:hypothetical protein